MTEGYSVKVRPEKVQAVDEIKERLGRAEIIVLTEYRGLTVTELAELRNRLRGADVEYKIVKNTLAQRATSESGISGLDDLFAGPTAVAFCYGDPVSAAKAITEFAKDHDALVIKGGVLEGRPISADEARDLATVDPLDVSLAKIAGSLTAPLQAIVGILQAPIARIAFVLEQAAARGDAGPLRAGGEQGPQAAQPPAETETPAPQAAVPETAAESSEAAPEEPAEPPEAAPEQPPDRPAEASDAAEAAPEEPEEPQQGTEEGE